MAVNIPQTVWRSTDGLTEYSSDGANYLIDTTNFYLVDTTGYYLVDTGVVENLIPATAWEEDDSI
jgi:flagellar basal body rod protein FlgG